MVRARRETIHLAVGSREVRFASPEDTILQKPVWYRLGGGVSEQQWKDVQSVLKIQGTALDFDYLEASARALDIVDLLEQAKASAR